MGEAEAVESNGLLRRLPGKINIHLRASHLKEIILLLKRARAWSRRLGQTRSDWRPGRPTGPASPSLTQSCGCTPEKQLIPLFYGEEGGGGLTNQQSGSFTANVSRHAGGPSDWAEQKAKVRNECGK